VRSIVVGALGKIPLRLKENLRTIACKHIHLSDLEICTAGIGNDS